MDLAIQHLLDTNDIPSDEEVQQINQILEEPIARLTIVNRDILNFSPDIQPNALEDERNVLKNSIESYRAITSAARRLPPDVLEEIFVHCLPTEHNAIMSVAEPPLSLGLVCGAWREISRSFSVLWATIHIAVPIKFPGAPLMNKHRDETSTITLEQKGFKERIVERAEAVKSWLERARDQPLSISLLQRNQSVWGTINDSHVIFDILFQALVPFRARWKCVAFAAPDISLATSLSRFPVRPENELPILESVNIELEAARRSGYRRPEVKDIDILKVPQLRNVTIANLSDMLPWTSPSSWSQITRLWMHGPQCSLSVAKALRIFEIFPRLTSCGLEINDDGRHLTTRQSLNSVTSPLLEILSVAERTDARLLFDCLDAPALREVEFSRQAGRGLDEPSLLVLLLKAGKTLGKLSINPRRITKKGILACLNLATSITHLSFRKMDYPGHSAQWQTSRDLASFPMDDDILGSLTPASESVEDCFCPRLQKFVCTTPSVFSSQMLLAFIQERSVVSRLAGVEQLKYVYIVVQEGEAESTASQFGHFVGLVDIRFRDAPPALKSFPDLSPWNGLRIVDDSENE